MLRGDKLRMMRLYKKIRQVDVADAIGITRAYLSMLENERRGITEDVYRKWIDYLNSHNMKSEYTEEDY